MYDGQNLTMEGSDSFYSLVSDEPEFEEDNAYYYSDYLEYSQNEIDEMETTVMHFEKY